MHTDEISDISERRNWFYPVGQYFEFQLRTCENAQIRLAEIPKREETNGYDINLMNSISSIVKISDSSIQVSKDTPLLLDCTVLRRFWITWSQGVKVGRGRLNSDVLLDLQDATPVAIAAIAITTPAITAGGGEWQVKRDTGLCLPLKSYLKYSFYALPFVTQRSVLLLRLQDPMQNLSF